MPFQLSNYDHNFEESPVKLIVSAGTVTCKKVEDMGAGFTFFKKFFSRDPSWPDLLQKKLDSYHGGTYSMDAYVRIAEIDGVFGGVATVPSKRHKKCLESTYSDEQSVLEYSSAIEQALTDAKALDGPVFLQPLGIGVYGWDPVKAADLVITIRKRVDPSNQLAIIVPIFDKKLGSNDDLYAKKLCSAFVQDVKFCAEKASLTAILLTLIGEISIKIGGSSSSKAQQLNDLFYQIQMQRNPEKSVDAYITEIRGIVQKKRHPWHFWKTPESFTRFEELVSNAFPQRDPNPHSR